MSHLKIVPVTFAALLTLCGCNSTPTPATATTPAKTAVAPVATPIIPGTDAQRLAADEKLWRGVEEKKKKRKSGSAYVIKSKAYTQYIP